MIFFPNQKEEEDEKGFCMHCVMVIASLVGKKEIVYIPPGLIEAFSE